MDGVWFDCFSDALWAARTIHEQDGGYGMKVLLVQKVWGKKREKKVQVHNS